jgi:hypothetical protein
VAGIRVVSVVGKALAIADEVLHVPRGNSKAECFAATNTHVGDADDLALGVEERPARVARIDWRIGLDVGQTIEVSLRGRDDALRQRALKAERVSDREDALPGVERTETILALASPKETAILPVAPATEE